MLGWQGESQNLGVPGWAPHHIEKDGAESCVSGPPKKENSARAGATCLDFTVFLVSGTVPRIQQAMHQYLLN